MERLRVSGGRLAGRTTDRDAFLLLRRDPGPETGDILHSVEIRLRASAGRHLSFAYRRSENLELATFIEQVRVLPLQMVTIPLVPGEEMRTYVLPAPLDLTVSMSYLRNLLIRPTDAPEATFEIESVRLVSRVEHLTEMPSGIGWQGLSEIYRESLVARSPEVIRIGTTLPKRPWLDLAVGTLEQGPVTFRVSIAAGRPRNREEVVLDRTVTTAHRWEQATVDLSRYAGEEVDLVLSLHSERSGALGFWGSPVVRSHRADAEEEEQAAGTPPQGVILLVADTLRSDHLEAYRYGRKTAPHVLGMARDGVIFRDCQAQGSWTKLSMSSILTSLYPSSHGVIEFDDRLPNSAETLAEVYRKAGYATLALTSIYFVGRSSNLHQGFEEMHELGSLVRQPANKSAREYVDRLLPWLEEHREVPFFVLLHVFDPHAPYAPYEPYDTLWSDRARKEEFARQQQRVAPFISDLQMRNLAMPSRSELEAAGIEPGAFVAEAKNGYDGSIRAMDAEIARLLGHLRTLGLDRRVLVAFTSDHGEEFLEHGRTSHGQSVYGELTNVPLILWGPGVIPAGQEVEDVVKSIDLMPTLLEISRLPLPERIQGTSLVPLFNGARPRPRPVFSEKPSLRKNRGPAPRETGALAVIHEDWKLIWNTRRPPGAPEYELYDHRNDPLDRTDLATRRPAEVKRLARILTEWQQRVKAQRLKTDSEVERGLQGRELEQLRSLGYIQ